MTGKIPNLEPASSGLRIKGAVRQYWSPFYKKWITRSWPKSAGEQTVNRLAAQNTFTVTVKMIKQISDLDWQASHDLVKNTPFLPRDVQMKAATGTLVEAVDDTGQLWTGRRVLYPDIQQLLDSIDNSPGDMLIRTPDGWLALQVLDTPDAYVLTLENGLPQWAPPQGDAIQGGINYAIPPFSTTYSSSGHATKAQCLSLFADITIDRLIAAISPQNAATRFKMAVFGVSNAASPVITSIEYMSPVFTPPAVAQQLMVLTMAPFTIGAGRYAIALIRTDSTGTAQNGVLNASGNSNAYQGCPIDVSTPVWANGFMTIDKAAPGIGDTFTAPATTGYVIGFRSSNVP